jgi:hypothetical protein
MIPYSTPVEASVLARGADELNVSVTLLRKTLKWFGELPSGVRDELLENARRPLCGVPRNATIQP